MLYARHYKPWLVYVLPHFSLAFVINVLIINRDHTGNICTKQGNSAKKSAVSNQEQGIVARVRYMHLVQVE